MEDFNDMVSNWQKQPVPNKGKEINGIVRNAAQNAKTAQHLQRNTIIVLGITTLALAVVAIASQGASALFYTGLTVMLFALLLRIAIEARSIANMKRIGVAAGTLNYAQALKKFYCSRKRIHGILTYAILALYAAGFCLMLPTFRQTLPPSFYNYIVICGIVLLPAIAIFIAIMNRKELRTINASIEELSSIESMLK